MNSEPHDWRKDEDGNTDIFAWEYGHHGGPICVRCDDYYCAWCEDDRWENRYTEPCKEQTPYMF